MDRYSETRLKPPGLRTFHNNKSNLNNKVNKLFNSDVYDLVNIDLNSLNYLKDYLLNKNSENHFILDDNVDIDLLKKIALSNNELIIVDKGNINKIHKKIANRIV